MSKAEERANEAYPKATRDIGGIVTDIGHPQYMRDLYIEGYHQAEKDLELTWEDVEYIIETYNRMEYSREFVGESYNGVCKEVLKRFRDFKERKEK